MPAAHLLFHPPVQRIYHTTHLHINNIPILNILLSTKNDLP